MDWELKTIWSYVFPKYKKKNVIYSILQNISTLLTKLIKLYDLANGINNAISKYFHYESNATYHFAVITVRTILLTYISNNSFWVDAL